MCINLTRRDRFFPKRYQAWYFEPSWRVGRALLHDSFDRHGFDYLSKLSCIFLRHMIFTAACYATQRLKLRTHCNDLL